MLGEKNPKPKELCIFLKRPLYYWSFWCGLSCFQYLKLGISFVQRVICMLTCRIPGLFSLYLEYEFFSSLLQTSSPFWATWVWQRLLGLNIGALLLAHGGIFQLSPSLLCSGYGHVTEFWPMAYEQKKCVLHPGPPVLGPSSLFCLNLNGLGLEEGGTSRRKGLGA